MCQISCIFPSHPVSFSTFPWAMLSLRGLLFGQYHCVKTKGTPGHCMSILKKPQGNAGFVFPRNLSKWFDSRVNPVQHQVSDHTGKLVKTPSSYKETSNPMPERGMQSIWPVHGENIGTERDGGLQLLPFDVIFLSLGCSFFLLFCTSLCCWLSEPRYTLGKLDNCLFSTKAKQQTLPAPGGAHPLHGRSCPFSPKEAFYPIIIKRIRGA